MSFILKLINLIFDRVPDRVQFWLYFLLRTEYFYIRAVVFLKHQVVSLILVIARHCYDDSQYRNSVQQHLYLQKKHANPERQFHTNENLFI